MAATGTPCLRFCTGLNLLLCQTDLQFRLLWWSHHPGSWTVKWLCGTCFPCNQTLSVKWTHANIIKTHIHGGRARSTCSHSSFLPLLLPEPQSCQLFWGQFSQTARWRFFQSLHLQFSCQSTPEVKVSHMSQVVSLTLKYAGEKTVKKLLTVKAQNCAFTVHKTVQ